MVNLKDKISKRMRKLQDKVTNGLAVYEEQSKVLKDACEIEIDMMFFSLVLSRALAQDMQPLDRWRP